MSGRPLFGHVHVIEDHNDNADRAYWQCYSQGHFPCDPRRVVTARRHFLTWNSRLLCTSSTVPTCPYKKHRQEEILISIVMHHDSTRRDTALLASLCQEVYSTRGAHVRYRYSRMRATYCLKVYGRKKIVLNIALLRNQKAKSRNFMLTSLILGSIFTLCKYYTFLFDYVR